MARVPNTITDRLARIEVVVENCAKDIEEERRGRENMNTNITSQITEMKLTVEKKLDSHGVSRDARFTDMETRMRKLERVLYIATGVILTIEVLFKFLIGAH